MSPGSDNKGNPFPISRPGISRNSDAVNRYLLTTLARAWDQYPSETDLLQLGSSEDDLVSRKMLENLRDQGLIEVGESSVALTEHGHIAVLQASWAHKRLRDFLRDRELPTDRSSTASLLLAILRAHLALQKQPPRRES